MESTFTFSPEEYLDPDACTGCAICVRVCPSLVISLPQADGPPHFAESGCIGCAHCAAWCPKNAFGMQDRSPDPPSPKELDSLLRSRRSTRVFSDREPTEEVLLDLCRGALGWSPTGTNSCGLDVRLVGRKRLDRMLDSARRAARWLNILGALSLAARLVGMRRALSSFLQGEDMIFRGAPLAAFVFVRKRSSTPREDGVIAAALLSLRAETMGMGSLWNGVAVWLCRLLPGWRLPDTGSRRLVAVLCLGYPRIRPRWQVPPRPFGLRTIGLRSSPEAGEEG